jgi:hypothetical protein
MKLKEIKILNKAEYKKSRSFIPAINDPWWLRDFGTSKQYVCCVGTNGNIDAGGLNISNDYVGVRPACVFELDAADFMFWHKPETLIGTKVEFGANEWTILDAKNGSVYAVCNSIIEHHRFDSNTNVWEESELKQWLETEGIRKISEI